jgi:hypothetical protein
MSIQKRKKYTKYDEHSEEEKIYQIRKSKHPYNFLNPKIKFSVATFNGCEVKR